MHPANVEKIVIFISKKISSGLRTGKKNIDIEFEALQERKKRKQEVVDKFESVMGQLPEGHSYLFKHDPESTYSGSPKIIHKDDNENSPIFRARRRYDAWEVTLEIEDMESVDDFLNVLKALDTQEFRQIISAFKIKENS